MKGSGRIASETRDLDEFDKLTVNVSAYVSVVVGERPRCVIKCDDNIIPLLSTSVENRSLTISADESYSTRNKVEIRLETPVLRGVVLNGSGKVDVDSVTTDDLALRVNGSGCIRAKGNVKNLAGAINGSGELRLADLEARRCAVTLNGSGDANVHVLDSLNAQVNGSGSVTYSGSPDNVSSVVNGSGDIIKE